MDLAFFLGALFSLVRLLLVCTPGSVVGWVGAGGNIGGACFSVLFIQFDYEKAFALMGVMAACSSVFSCFLDCKRLSLNAASLRDGVVKKNDGHASPPRVTIHENGAETHDA